MKMYHFNGGLFGGVSYTVMAPGPSTALSYVQEKVFSAHKEFANDVGEELADLDSNWKDWEDATVDSLPEGYTLEEFDVGKVMETEES